MRNKNKKIIYWGIGIILIALISVGAYFVLSGKISTENLLSFNIYDSNGNKITDKPLSVVGGVPGVSYIDLTITVLNTGTEALSCEINSLYPDAFNNAVSKTIKNVNPGNKVAWTSSLIQVSQFESETIPTEFKAGVVCSYNTGTEIINLPEKIGILPLLIQSDGIGSFEVEVSQGGTGEEFCGDNICQSDEDSQTCPADCTVTNYVKFRTTDLSYVSGSAIGYASSCGNNLVGYGYYSSTGILTGDCTSISTWCGSNPVKILDDLPGGWKSGGPAPNLWKVDETDTICLCDSDGSKYNQIKFKSTDSDASKVDTSPIGIDSAKEISC